MMVTALLRLETVVVLTAARILLACVPFRALHRLFGSLTKPRISQDTNKALTSLARSRAVALRVRRVANCLPWRSTCLVRAMAGAALLSRRRIEGVNIRLGVRNDNGKLAAHAWLMLGSEILLGEEEAEGFTPLADLGETER